MGSLSGTVAVVTGGAGAIGGAIARALAGEGCFVVVADVREDAAREVATSVGGEGVRLDVADSAAWSELVARVSEAHGGPDILVNNAGTHTQALVENLTDEEWDRVVTTNAYGVFYGCRAVIEPMRARGGGSILNVVTGMFGVAYSSAYSSSKFMVEGFSRCLALEVARYGIRVNTIAPGALPYSGFERWYREKAALLGVPYDEFLDGVRESIPLRRFATPEDIANGALYLVGPGASYVTGHRLEVAGGFTGYSFAVPADPA